MKVFVVGAGTMGAGIAEVFAARGDEVWLYDTVEAAVRSGLNRLEASLCFAVEQQRLSPEERERIRTRVHTATELDEAADADLVLEAVFENLDIKQELFEALDSLCKPEAILASNTMALSITELAAGLDHADRVVGLHFFNPAPETGLVEVVHTLRTDPKVCDQAVEWVRSLGKRPILVPDYPGFIVNRLAMPQINLAAQMLMEGCADAESLDAALVLADQHKLGPLHQADRIGIDTVVQILETLYADTGDVCYRPCPLLVRMANAGLLGCKTGQGFFRYED